MSLDVVLEASDATTGVFPALTWDLAGGDLLDITLATEVGSVALNGKNLTNINGSYRMGAPGTNGSFFANGSSFPTTFTGPTFASGWELAGPLGDNAGVSGPGSFSVGTAEFVIRGTGTTILSFYNLPGVNYTSIVGGPGFQILDLGQEVELGSLTIRGIDAIPEPSAPALFAVGLGLIAPSQRRARSA